VYLKISEPKLRLGLAGGIPPKPPFRPPAEATLSDWTISSFSLAANSFLIFSYNIS